MLPSLRISGGVQETLRLAKALAERGVQVRVLVFWKHIHESSSFGLPVDHLSSFAPQKSQAIWRIPQLAYRYLRYFGRSKQPKNDSPSLLLTHYTMFPFAWLTPRLRRVCFNQDVEWMFLPSGFLRDMVRLLILFTSKRSKVITTNEFISAQYLENGVVPFAQASIWAPAFWLAPRNGSNRSIDLVMLLRHGTIKRLDLYLELLRKVYDNTSWTCVVITPEDAIHEQVKMLASQALLRPSNESIRELYGISKVFVLLSDTEGFGLPPLEAMGSGCVPVCRDSGGVRNYMTGPLTANLISPEESISEIFIRLQQLLENCDKLAELSDVVVEVFRRGLHQSSLDREASFDQLALTLAR